MDKHAYFHSISLDLDVVVFMSLKEQHDIYVLNELKESLEEHTSPMLPPLGLCMPLTPFSYFGGQGRFYPFVKKMIIENIKNWNGCWVDGTAGGLGMPIEACKDGYNLILNDYSFLTYCIASSLFCKHINIDINFFKKDNFYLKKNNYLFNFNESTIDYIYNYFLLKDDNRNLLNKLAVLGIYLMKYYTFKGRYWDKYAASLEQSFSKFLNNVLIVENEFNFVKNIITVCKKEVKLYNNKVEDFLKIVNDYRGTQSFIYYDFAWPWKGKIGISNTEVNVSKCSEYSVPGSMISSILKNEYIPSYDFWTHLNTYQKVEEILDLSFQKFDYVLLNTQSTNYPDHENLITFLRDNYNLIDFRYLDALSFTYSNSFREYFYLLKEK